MRRFLSIKTSSTCMSAGRSNNSAANVARMEFVFNEGSPGEWSSFSCMISLPAHHAKCNRAPFAKVHNIQKQGLFPRNRVGGQRGTVHAFDLPEYTLSSISASPFPTAPLRTGRAPFSASGSPGPQFIFPGLSHPPVQHRYLPSEQPCTPFPCIGHYPDHLSTMDALSS